MLQIIRDIRFYKHKDAMSFVSALKRESKKKEVIVNEIIIGDNEALNSVNWINPTVIIEPFALNIPVEHYNDIDENATAEVISDICNGYFRKKILILNRSKLIGKPLINMLLEHDHTVTVAHSKSALTQKDIDSYDLIIFATGKEQSKFNCTDKIVIDVSNDYAKEKCAEYFSMSYIGTKTVEKIVEKCR